MPDHYFFEGERCMYCNVNMYDAMIYDDDPEDCPVEREPVKYTTETPAEENR